MLTLSFALRLSSHAVARPTPGQAAWGEGSLRNSLVIKCGAVIAMQWAYKRILPDCDDVFASFSAYPPRYTERSHAFD